MEARLGMIVLICATIVFASVAMVADGESSNFTMSTILEEIFDGYDKKLSPKYNATGFDRQVKVIVNLFVNSMFSISEANMDYSLSMFLRERWLDDRLRYTDTLNIKRLELDTSMFGHVWMPDMYILNEKSSNFHEVTVPNKLIHVYPDGTVQYSARVTGIFSCTMYLQKYPFDTQTCHIEVESYGHSTETLKFVWGDDAVSVRENVQFPQFELAETKHYTCEKDYYGIIYPCIGVEFILERSYIYYIVQIYVPSILIVILSWVNFWLDCTAVPARISLSLLTVLTMTTQSAGARANLPRVSYVKAIDVYMAVCLAFVFLGLIEFAYVNVLTRVESRKSKNNDSECEAKEDKSNSIDTKDVDVSVPQTSNGFLCMRRLTDMGRARFVDKISRFIFPVSFLLFNVVYWVFYFLWNPNFKEE